MKKIKLPVRYSHHNIFNRNRVLACIVFSGILLMAFSGGKSLAADIIFKDIQNHWAQADIKRAVDAGYIKGYVDLTFRPENTVTRAEFVSMLNAAFGVSTDGTGSRFKDVKSSDWFAPDVWAAVKAGYLNIYTGDTFKPDQPLTRQEAAVLTENLAKIVPGDKKVFKDIGLIPDWAMEQVYALTSTGIINGNPDGYFMPEEDITRAEAVAIINRAKTYMDSIPLHALLKVTGSLVNIRSGPDTSYNIVTEVKRGDILTALMHSSNDWYKVTKGGLSGWITGDYVTVNNIADRGGDVDRGDSSDSGADSERQNGSENGADSIGQNGLNSGADSAKQNGLNSGALSAGQNGSENGADPIEQNALNSGLDSVGQNGSENGANSIEQNALNSRADSTGQADSTGSDNSVTVTDPTGEVVKDSSSKLVVVDAGHGGYDIGATGFNGTMEKDINLAIAIKLSNLLKQAGYNILLTRSDDTFIPLSDRSALANNAKSDIFISIHCNVSKKHDAGGTEVLTEPVSLNPVYGRQEDSKRLAGLIQSELVGALGLKDRGVKDQDLAVCRETNAPAILIETAFIDNKQEEELLNDSAAQDRVSAAIKQGIDNYFLK